MAKRVLVAGLDAAYDGERCWAAAVVWDTRAEAVVDQAVAKSRVTFPYVPGLLALRELPVLLKALRLLDLTPDILLCDAHGRAHPSRFGLACALGEASRLPVIGCAKSRLVGAYRDPGKSKGSREPLVDGGERIGTVLRTRAATRPLFVSIGSGLELAEAERIVMRCVGSFRIPEPLRLAHVLARQAARTARRS